MLHLFVLCWLVECNVKVEGRREGRRWGVFLRKGLALFKIWGEWNGGISVVFVVHEKVGIFAKAFHLPADVVTSSGQDRGTLSTLE